MPTIKFQDQNYELKEGVSVLDTLLDAGLTVPHGCKSGVCQSCMMRAVEGEVPPEAQKGLKEMQQKKNFFLACSCHPKNDLSVALPGEGEILQYQVTVLEKDWLNDTVIRLRLSLPEDFLYKAGQFINLIKDAGTQRSYSLASVPEQDKFLELQIKVLENGMVSGWIKDQLVTGANVTISEAHGDCYYSQGNAQQSILLIGTGTGLAPLYGVVRDALTSGHQGDVFLYHGASNTADLYLQSELQALTTQYSKFTYTACVSQGEASGNVVSGRANDVALQNHSNLKDWKIFLCGNPNMVEATRKKAFLAGANFKEILVDAFKFATS